VSTPSSDLRVLQVLGHNDRDGVGQASLELHRELARRGMQVRTLALAPGREAGLSAVVPTMSPSARSLAAHTQLRREQRWADVVILRGQVPAAAAGLSRMSGAPPTVLALTDEPEVWSDVPIPSRVMRLLGRAAAVVVTSPSQTASADRWHMDPADVHVIPYGVTTTDVSDSRRVASRAALGLPADGVVAHLTRPAADDDGLRARLEGLGVGITVIEPRDDRIVHFGAPEPEDTEELAVAAADVVVSTGPETSGPPWELLRGAAWGRAVIVDRWPGRAPELRGALAELLDDSTGWTDLGDAITAGRAEIERRGSAARRRVAERFSMPTVGAAWADLLGSLSDRR